MNSFITIKEKDLTTSVTIPYARSSEDLLLVCPVCKEVWAEIKPERSGYIWANIATCRYCDSIDPVRTPGSIIDNYFCNCYIDVKLLNHLPEELIRREFELALKLFEETPCQNPTPNQIPLFNLFSQESMSY